MSDKTQILAERFGHELDAEALQAAVHCAEPVIRVVQGTDLDVRKKAYFYEAVIFLLQCEADDVKDAATPADHGL